MSTIHFFSKSWWWNRIVTQTFLHLEQETVTYPPYKWPEQQENHHVSAPISVSYQLGTVPDTACTPNTERTGCLKSLYYICTGICTTEWTHFTHPAEDGSCFSDAEMQWDFLCDRLALKLHPKLNHLAELILVSIPPVSLI